MLARSCEWGATSLTSETFKQSLSKSTRVKAPLKRMRAVRETWIFINRWLITWIWDGWQVEGLFEDDLRDNLT